MTEPLDNTADFSDALVVGVSLWSLSVKFIVPERTCAADEPVVWEFSLKPAVAADDVIFGLWFVMIQPPLPARHSRAGALNVPV